jgi:hypothetical protein
MFDPPDDAHDRHGRERARERVYDERDREDDLPEGLMRDLDLPRGNERELVVDRDRVYELDGEDSRALAAAFDFLGYTFQPRRAKNRWEKFFVSFLLAMSAKAAKLVRQTIREWRMASTRNNQRLEDASTTCSGGHLSAPCDGYASGCEISRLVDAAMRIRVS